MRIYSVLIVDDEAPARAKIRRYINDRPEFQIVDEAINGTSAFSSIVQMEPDLVFLDVHMPAITGLDVLRMLPSEQRPSVIFCTAYDAFAVDAFELNAVDYLLKPIGQTRFNAALDRFLSAPPQPENMTRLLQNIKSTSVERLPLRHRKRIKLINVGDIAYICTEQKVVTVYLKDGVRLWTPETMDEMERRLNPEQFFRIHRSAIINLAADFELEPVADGRMTVYFAAGVELPISRNKTKRLREALGF